MPTLTFKLDPSTANVQFPLFPCCGFQAPSGVTSFTANAKATNSEDVTYTISAGLDQGAYNGPESSHWWSAENKLHTSAGSGTTLANWRKLSDYSSGTTQTSGIYHGMYETNEVNGFPHIRFSGGDHLVMDSSITLNTGNEWTMVLVTGNQVPSLMGCFIGSNNTGSSSVQSAYHWGGRVLKIRNELGDEVTGSYTSTQESGYGGGSNAIHIIRSPGNGRLTLRWNGNDLNTGQMTANSDLTFDMIAKYKTTSTQRYGNYALLEWIIFDHDISGDDLSDLEGHLACKYDINDKLPSSHAWYNATNSTGYNTPKTNTNLKTTTSDLVLTTNGQSFQLKSSNLTSDTEYVFYPLDYGDPGEIEFTASWS